MFFISYSRRPGVLFFSFLCFWDRIRAGFDVGVGEAMFPGCHEYEDAVAPRVKLEERAGGGGIPTLLLLRSMKRTWFGLSSSSTIHPSHALYRSGHTYAPKVEDCRGALIHLTDKFCLHGWLRKKRK